MRCGACRGVSLRLLVVSVVLVAGLVQICESKPADKTLGSSTTEKPIKHPSYVRVLKRGKGNDTVTDVTEEELKDAVVVTPGNGTDAKIKIPDRQLSTDEIRGIIPFLNFQNNEGSSDRTAASASDTNGKPARTGILDVFSRVFDSIRGIGEARNRNGGRAGSRTREAGENQNATATRTTGRSNENAGRGPGGFIAGIMKALQSMTITVESMVMSFVKLFDLSSSRNKV